MLFSIYFKDNNKKYLDIYLKYCYIWFKDNLIYKKFNLELLENYF